jgi:hypothetical protein
MNDNEQMIALIAGAIGLLWFLSGYLSSKVNLGGSIADIPLSKNNIPTGGSTVTLGEIAVTSNPLDFIPNAISALSGGSGGLPSLNLSVTNTAFSKIGLTTPEVEKLENQLGQVNYMALQGRIIAGNLTDNDKALLYSVGWDGSEG